MLTEIAAHLHRVQDPDVHTATPWYVTVGALVVLACLVVLVALAVRSHRSDRRQRARHALDRAHRQARLAEIVRTAPDLSVLVPPVDAAPSRMDLDAPTRVIPLPAVKPRGGRHAKPSPIGAARVPLNLSRLRVGRGGGWRA